MASEAHVQIDCTGRQTQWVACTFSVEGAVRDSLRVSDVDDLMTVESNLAHSYIWF